MDWVLLATTGIQWILWINGAAGAGKSAIARSVVALCLKQRIVIARFFFFRTDSTRNNTKPVVATLAYQLIKSIPALDSIISPIIQSDPLIFHESLETQLEVLIFEPLRQLHKESPIEKPIVFLLDGVDECDGHVNQANVIDTIAKFVAEKAVPLIVVFSSRTELQLQMAFNSPRVDSILRRLPLDTDYRAGEDIRLFLDDSFAKIKTTHPFKSSMVPEWPAPSLVQEIVDKSSNQFIYASVVVKFISSPRLHPVQQLDIVCGLRPAGELTPFAQLDALYRHIFSEVHDITHVTAILAVVILSKFLYRGHICAMLDIADNDITVALADLTSVVSDAGVQISFLHASLPDFLLDQSRAQQYYIDKGVWCERFAVKCLSEGMYIPGVFHRFLSQARRTPQLREAVFAFDLSIIWDGTNARDIITYIDIVHNMDFGDGGEVYRHQLNLAVRLMDKEYPDDMNLLQESYDITGILDKIAEEKAAASKRTELTVEENSGGVQEITGVVDINPEEISATREVTELPVEEDTPPEMVNSPRKASLWVHSKARVARIFKKQ
ncbi:hypothetical protein HYPSUDRAFT_815991 [Hypholoma sublateritium FD-334 SS-4]|uniref:Nephrocystin 3-like N-terminal domain-containing protein n=1 Tax=Hypholoma sublateritium (strain FD-334 SS-4) TaxID=945553 RepID=A0A0D2NUU0_HYPSF|nr:hypothetical protein HYPSUDRAFT_815991 [Hypholoma sublateritium FD-334 SS-4]